MNDTAKKLREAAEYIGDGETCSDTAIVTVREMFDVGRADTFGGDLGRVLVAIADELDKLQTKANEANNLRQRLESAEGKAERRKRHIGYLNTALHDKNGLLERRGGTIARLTAENADLRKRVPSEREREILDMWPRFEDGEYVMPGDKAHYVSTHNDGTEIEVESITMMDGLFVLCDDECRANQYEQVERVKRPARSALDADGVEIRVGDTVWHEDGSEWFVEEITRLGARCFDGERRRTFVPAFLTHIRPDSWERLEEDAELNDETGIVGGNLDIVRRAKALAGVEVD